MLPEQKPLPKEIENYINERYFNWLDYSTYQCTHQNLIGHEGDILNEVLEDLMQKPTDLLMDLYNRAKFSHKYNTEFRELDYFVLKMLQLNTSSNTAPYRHKFVKERIPIDDNLQSTELYFIIDEPDEERDEAGEILAKRRILREFIDKIKLTEYQKRVFIARYFENKLIKDIGEELGTSAKATGAELAYVRSRLQAEFRYLGWLDSKGRIKDEILEKFMSE